MPRVPNQADATRVPAPPQELQLSGLPDVWEKGLINLRSFLQSVSLQKVGGLKKRYIEIDLRASLHAEDVKRDLKFVSTVETRKLLAILRKTPFEIVELLSSGAFDHLVEILKFKPKKG